MQAACGLRLDHGRRVRAHAALVRPSGAAARRHARGALAVRPLPQDGGADRPALPHPHHLLCAAPSTAPPPPLSPHPPRPATVRGARGAPPDACVRLARQTAASSSSPSPSSTPLATATRSRKTLASVACCARPTGARGAGSTPFKSCPSRPRHRRRKVSLRGVCPAPAFRESGPCSTTNAQRRVLSVLIVFQMWDHAHTIVVEDHLDLDTPQDLLSLPRGKTRTKIARLYPSHGRLMVDAKPKGVC